MNPMLGLINSTPEMAQTAAANPSSDLLAAASQMRPIVQMLQSAKNPQAMIQQLCTQNPSFGTAYETAKNMAGGDPKAAFYSAAKAQGVDPDALVKALLGQ